MLVLVCAALTVLSGYYVLTPLFREGKGNLEVELLAETELDRLLNRKAIVYTNLKELEFEHKMGRLADGDFQRLEAGYKSEAMAILQKLDQLGADQNLDETIERDVAARKAKLFAPEAAPEQASAKCPSCGAEIVAQKKFCADCGQRL